MSRAPLQTVIDSLDTHIAVIDDRGMIIAVNEAWRQFARKNGCDDKRVSEGVNYLEVCRDSASRDADLLSADVLRGIREVISGARTEFSLEYPCHSDTEQRWFLVKVRPLAEDRSQLLVAHENISVYKVAGEQARLAAARQQREARTISSLAASDKLSRGSLHELAAELTEKAAIAIEAARVSVWLFDNAQATLANIDTYQAFSQTHHAGATLPDTLLRDEVTALQNAKCVVIDDAANDPRTAGYAEAYLRPNGIVSLLAAAIRSGDRLQGIVCLEHTGSPHRWENDEISFASQLADQVALTCANQERQQASTALLFSERHFKALFQEHAAVKLIIDPEDGRILDANKAAAEFYGWTLEQLRKMSIHDINTFPVETVRRAMGEAKANRRRKFEFRHRLADGSIRDVEAYGNVIEEEGRSILYSIIYDVTDRKCAEAERERLETQNRRLAKAEGLGRMAGAVAHHFNNHLQSVILALEMLRPHLDHDPLALQTLGAGKKAAREAAGLSTLMLTYLGQSFAHAEPLDLGELCRQRLPELRPLAPAGVSISEELCGPGLQITGNRSQIEQILLNLLTNAWEAFPAENPGKIRLSVKPWAAADIPTQNRLPLDWQPAHPIYAGIEVSDCGTGIPEANLEKIFDPFFTTKFHGRGLGLAVVLGIVREHQGVITVQSTSGKGSCFQVFFPAMTPPASTQPARA